MVKPRNEEVSQLVFLRVPSLDLFFLVCINDLTENLRYNVKLFADDTSLFIVALDVNHDLALITLWVHTWRIFFNPNPAKQAMEVAFSRKIITVDHP